RWPLVSGTVAIILLVAYLIFWKVSIDSPSTLGARPFGPRPHACDGKSSLDCAFMGRSRLWPVLEPNQGREVHMPETISDWTVTIKRVYADVHRIVIGYSVSGPEIERFIEPISPTLNDLQGTHFPWQDSLDAPEVAGVRG